MATNLFLCVLDMSRTASLVILFVMALRLPLKRLPKAFSYGLWSVVLFRLLCPVSFERPFSQTAFGGILKQSRQGRQNKIL